MYVFIHRMLLWWAHQSDRQLVHGVLNICELSGVCISINVRSTKKRISSPTYASIISGDLSALHAAPSPSSPSPPNPTSPSPSTSSSHPFLSAPSPLLVNTGLGFSRTVWTVTADLRQGAHIPKMQNNIGRKSTLRVLRQPRSKGPGWGCWLPCRVVPGRIVRRSGRHCVLHSCRKFTLDQILKFCSGSGKNTGVGSIVHPSGL